MSRIRRWSAGCWRSARCVSPTIGWRGHSIPTECGAGAGARSASKPISASNSSLGPALVSDLLGRLTARHPQVEVWAAGGVVVRDGPDGPEVLLVHRPAQDDWSLPKGKLDPGETLKKAARREVEEETGLRCSLDEKLGLVRYFDARNRDKAVVYWLMTPRGGAFVANGEVDEVEWLPLEEAAGRCTYDHDSKLLRRRVGRLLAAR